MAEKLTDEQVAGLVAILGKDASIDAKVQYVSVVKSGIKQHNVPESCVAPLFDALRVASSSQHSVLVNAGFTALNHLITRLSRQEPRYLVKEAKHTLPLIVEKMGDQKDKIRTLALQAMETMYVHVPVDAERFVRNNAMVGKNARAKEAGMQWLLQMNKDHGLQFRSYVPTLMELLEDADGMVRDNAKMTVIELFRDAPNGAKSDLKKQLKSFKVRPAIEQAIVKELVPTGGIKRDLEPRPESALSSRPNLSASVSSMASERPITPAPETKGDAVEPSYVNTQRELDDIFKGMHPWFEGRESEQNWLKREESITKLRRLIAGNASSDFPDAFVAGCRSLLDGILKAVNSLRTSLSKEGCTFVQELTNTFGPGIDPMVELLMQTFIKLCAATKKIASQTANITVDTIIGRTTYTARIMQHVWSACQDKNVQPRLYTAGWLKTLIKKEAHHKNHIEHSGGLDLIEKCIKKGLNDPNPGVREKMRSTYWAFATIWPARAEVIMDNLEATAQKLLQKDPANPNSPKKSEPAPRPGLGLSKSTMTSSKPSLREAMLAQKKALASKTLPPRPGSAMATITPVRSTSGSSHSSTTTATTTAATKPATRTRPESSTISHGGMSVAPMRPARRRPEMVARPATAGPYSVRSHEGTSTERSSPGESFKQKTATPKTISGSPRRTAPRARPGHAATLSETSVPTPSKAAASKATASPRASPARLRPVPSALSSRPSIENEDLTLVVSSAASFRQSHSSSLPRPSPKASPRPALPTEDDNTIVPRSSTATPTPPEPLKVYEDPFTAEEAPQPTSNGSIVERPVLEDRPVNEAVANLSHISTEPSASPAELPSSPEKARQNSRLLDSGITRVKAQTLDVHGFRKLQSLIRDSKSSLPSLADDKFDALLMGLFEYLESPLDSLSPEKVQDVKAQVLATIKLLLKKYPDRFQPHIARGLEALLASRARYQARNHIVSGLELLADELVAIGDAGEILVTMTSNLGKLDHGTATTESSHSRSLSMGLHVLRQLIESRGDGSFSPSDAEIANLAALCARCLESAESAVRMDAVQLCVALHARLGEARFWDVIRDVRDDPKSLITYYVVKRQREREAAGGRGVSA